MDPHETALVSHCRDVIGELQVGLYAFKSSQAFGRADMVGLTGAFDAAIQAAQDCAPVLAAQRGRRFDNPTPANAKYFVERVASPRGAALGRGVWRSEVIALRPHLDEKALEKLRYEAISKLGYGNSWKVPDNPLADPSAIVKILTTGRQKISAVGPGSKAHRSKYGTQLVITRVEGIQILVSNTLAEGDMTYGVSYGLALALAFTP